MPIIKEDPLRKYDPAKFEYDSIKGEVVDAMQYDWKRDKVDDAKKRAIHAAHNYDDFKQRVAGCTLNPIHRNEFNAPPKFNFNRQAGTGGGDASAPPLLRTGGYANSKDNDWREVDNSRPSRPAVAQAPQNSHAFEREFRRQRGSAERVELLQRLDGDAVARIFRTDIDAEVLRQLLVALDEVRCRGAARRFLLELATRCPSSATAASSFFGPEEKNLVARLLARDQAYARDPKEDVRICGPMGVKPSAVAEMVAEDCQPYTSDDDAAVVAEAEVKTTAPAAGQDDNSAAADAATSATLRVVADVPEASAAVDSSLSGADEMD
jgi:hypothetical protein